MPSKPTKHVQDGAYAHYRTGKIRKGLANGSITPAPVLYPDYLTAIMECPRGYTVKRVRVTVELKEK